MTRTAAEYFPGCLDYAPDDPPPRSMLREASAKGRVFGHTERHLQAVWYDPRWRPAHLLTHRGERVEVESPGAWNLEAGPDFLGASLRVGPDQRRLVGDVEVHIFPSGWKQHGHLHDVRYNNVCLHLTYFEGSLNDDDLPRGALQVAMRPSLKADSSFAFEHVDVTAYPYAGRAEIPPCRAVVSSWPPEARRHLLESAGHERLRKKTELFAEAIAERGVDQVFYEAFMGVLGYQHNKRPFHELATRMPVDRLRDLACGDVQCAYALLAGAAGLLPSEMKAGWDDETKNFVRSLWDIWWKVKEHFPASMTRGAWRLAGVRPLNHPARRMMAAAALAVRPEEGLTLLERWLKAEPGRCGAAILSTLEQEAPAYWSFRHSLGGEKSATSIALLGEERIEAMALNLVIPMGAACGFDPDLIRRHTTAAPPEAVNHIMRQCAFYLLGRDYPSALMKTASQRQGLLQIFHDYCLHDRSRCAECDFPARLKQLNLTRQDG
jgi:hypothetical protein